MDNKEGVGVASPGVGVDDSIGYRVCTLVDPVRHCNSDAFQVSARRGAVAANRKAAHHYLLVLSCWATLCSHTPVTASSPHTAAMKSRTGRDQMLLVSEARLHTQTRNHAPLLPMPSSRVEFQLVAGLSAVQSGGSSSATTTFGYGYHGE